MLEISANAMAAFHEQGLRDLRGSVIRHWREALPRQLGRLPEQAIADILSRLDQLSREDRNLTVADLTMLADLMLVEADNEFRNGGPH